MKRASYIVVLVLAVSSLTQAVLEDFETAARVWTAYVTGGPGGAQANYPAPVGSLNGPSAPGSNVCVLQATAYYANVAMDGPLFAVNIPAGATFTVSYDVRFYTGYQSAGLGCHTWSVLALYDASSNLLGYAGPGGFATPDTAITTSWQTVVGGHTNTTGSTIAFVKPTIYLNQGYSPDNTWANAWIDNFNVEVYGSVSVWNVNGGGDWNTAWNWSNNVVPNGNGAVAFMLDRITAPATITNNADITIGKLKFANANKYTIAGSGSITLNDAGTAGKIECINGIHEISQQLKGSYGLTKTGNGTLILSFWDLQNPWYGNNYTGVTNINAGIVEIRNYLALGWLGVNNYVNISPGAALRFCLPDGTDFSGDKALYVSGSGPDGRGALILDTDVIGAQNSFAWSNVHFTGNTTIYSGGSYMASFGMQKMVADSSVVITKRGTGPDGFIGRIGFDEPSPDFYGKFYIAEGSIYLRHRPDCLGNCTGITLDNRGNLEIFTDGIVPNNNQITFNPYPLTMGAGTYPRTPVFTVHTFDGDGVNPPSGPSNHTWTGNITLVSDSLFWIKKHSTRDWEPDKLTITGSITGKGGLIKQGIGTLILKGVNDYKGTTWVTEGVLSLDGGSNNMLSDVGTLKIESGAKVHLGNGVNEKVGNLILNGVVKQAGTWGSSASAAQYKDDTYFTGNGILTVVPTLTGRVDLLDWNISPEGRPITVTFKTGATTTAFSSTLDSAGMFKVSTPGVGTYDILIKADHWLAHKETGVNIVAGDNQIFLPSTNLDRFEDQSWPWTAYVYEGPGGAQAIYPAAVGSLNGPSAPGSNVCVLQATAYYANIFMEGPLIPVNIPVGATFTVSYDVMFYTGYNSAGLGCYTWSTLGLVDANYQVVDHAGPGGFATPYTAITTSWQTPTSTHTNTTGTTIAYVRPRIYVQQGHSPSNIWANAWIDNYKVVVETKPRLINGDSNNDNSVNLKDFAVLAGSWGMNLSSPSNADLNGDNTVNLSDLEILVKEWLKSGATL